MDPGGCTMPVFTPQELRDNPDLSPQLSAYGVMSLERGQTIEPHFHDCDEWWIITDGHALVTSEGVEYEITEGHCVYTPMGEEHGLIEIYRELRGVWFEGPLQGKERRGHLHHPHDD
jgi:mannose-6-phosphate isomerase-like protein (cupin superfamily)